MPSPHKHTSTRSSLIKMQTIFKKIEADLNKNCLIIHYDIANGSLARSDTNNFRQIISINKPANQNVDIEKLARKILRKCDIIPALRLPELISALFELNKNRLLSSMQSYEFPFVMQNFLSLNSSLENLMSVNGVTFDSSNVSIGQIDFYIELLYDDLEDKIKGALSILNLVRNPENVCSLSKNDTLLCALSRVLREDGKKSLELSIYIACIFSYFANYVDFHFAISNYKVGSTCLELIYFEILREESWSKELNQKKELCETQIKNLKAKLGYEKLLVSYQNLVKKQNIFFKYALYLLMNISEDLKLEYKIVNKGIIPLLVKLLERNLQDLLLIIVIYLKKLSVFIENKTQMKELNIIKSLTTILFLDNELLIFNTLKLIYNLMIDREIRAHFIRSGAFTKLISFFNKGRYVSVIVSIFYLISCEAKYAAIFINYPQLIGLLIEKALQDVEYKMVLYNLLANLANNINLAHAMVECSDYSEMIKVTFLDKNIHLLRFCRNISCQQDMLLKISLLNYQENLIETMIGSLSNSAHLIECAAILANLSVVKSDWLQLYQKFQIEGFLRKVFDTNKQAKKSGASVLRHILLFVAATSHQPELSAYLIERNFVNYLIDLLNGNQENDDIVLNIVYCFYVFIKVAVELREDIVHKTKLSDYLIDLMYDRNFKIKSLCTATLDLISSQDDESEFSRKVKHEKFNSYNNKWLSMIQSDRASDESTHSLLEDLFIYPDLFLKMDILNDSSSDNFSDDNQMIENVFQSKRAPK